MREWFSGFLHEHAGPPDWRETDTGSLPSQSTISLECRLLKGNRGLLQAFPFRYLFRYEVQHLLERCGFSAVVVFGNFDKSLLADDSPEMIFVAKKVRDLEA